MAFTATSSRTGKTMLITLEGELDARHAATFLEEVDLAADGEIEQLVLEMTNLSYLSSAGLRGLIFARQKMTDNARLVLVGVTDAVEQTIRLVGFHHSVVLTDRVPLEDGPG
jgi:anti-anti-sigma factor